MLIRQMPPVQDWRRFICTELPCRRLAKATCIALRAAVMAATLGCRAIKTKNIVLQNLPGGKRMVTGTAVLEKAKVNA
jgi:hypothetical protein